MGYVCGFIGLLPPPFLFQFIILSRMLLCWCYPPRSGSLFKTSPLPRDDVTGPARPRLQAPAWPVAMRVTGTRTGPSCPPPLPPGSRLVSAGPETLATGGEQGPGWGQACHPEPPPHASPRGALPNGGRGVLFLPFFFPVVSSGPPTARSQDHRSWGGRTVRRSGGQTERARLPGTCVSRTAPAEPPEFRGHHLLLPSARPDRAQAADREESVEEVL